MDMNAEVKEENPIIIDLDDYKTIEELSKEWNHKVLKYFKYFFSEDTERSLSGVMKWYLQNLKEAVIEIDDNFMRNSMERHVLFLKLFFREVDCGFHDNYLEYMEDILVIYINIRVKTLPRRRNRTETVLREHLISICQRVLMMLRRYLLGQERRVAHVIMKIRMYMETEEARQFLCILFSYYVKANPTSKTDLTFCRVYIICQRWKSLKNRRDWDKIDTELFQSYGRTPESLETNSTLKRILKWQPNSVLDLLSSHDTNCEQLTKNYFKFIQSKDIDDFEQMQDLEIGAEDVPDFTMEEDEEFRKIYEQHVETMVNASTLRYIGAPIELLDDDDDGGSKEQDSDVEYLPGSTECIEILSDSEDEVVIESLQPSIQPVSNTKTCNSKQPSTSQTVQPDTCDTEQPSTSQIVPPETCNSEQPSTSQVVQPQTATSSQTSQRKLVTFNVDDESVVEKEIASEERRPPEPCPPKTVDTPSSDRVNKKNVVSTDTSTQTEVCEIQKAQGSVTNSFPNQSGIHVHTNNSNSRDVTDTNSQTESRSNSPQQLIVDTPLTISNSPQPSPNSTQHPSSSTSHSVNTCPGDSYVSPTSPDISSTLFDENDSIHESCSPQNSSAMLLDDGTSNDDNVTQSNIDIGESLGTPERESFSPVQDEPVVDHDTISAVNHEAVANVSQGIVATVDHKSSLNVNIAKTSKDDSKIVPNIDHSAVPSTSFGTVPRGNHVVTPSLNQKTVSNINHTMVPSTSSGTVPSVNHVKLSSIDHKMVSNSNRKTFSSIKYRTVAGYDRSCTDSEVEHRLEPTLLSGLTTPPDTSPEPFDEETDTTFRSNESMTEAVSQAKQVSEEKCCERIMFTSSQKIDRLSYDNFCQFEELVNRTRFGEEILTDRSLDLFANDNGETSETHSSIDIVSPSFEEGLDDFCENEQAHHSSNGTTDDSELSNGSLSKNTSPTINPIEKKSPVVSHEQTRVWFPEDMVQTEPHLKRSLRSTWRQPKGILRTSPQKLTRKGCHINPASLAKYKVSPYDYKLHSEAYIKGTELDLQAWQLAAEANKKVNFFKLPKAAVTAKGFVKVEYMPPKNNKGPNNISSWRRPTPWYQDSNFKPNGIHAIQGFYKGSPFLHVNYGTGNHTNANGTRNGLKGKKRNSVDFEDESHGTQPKKRKGRQKK